MMTTHVVFDLIARGKLRLDQKFMVRPDTWTKWHGPNAGSTMFLKPGEQVSVENLLKGIITLSGNDACVVLAEGVSGTEQAFVALMNEKATALGMTNSHFGTSNGWPDGGITYATARDLAILGRATIEHHPQFYKQFYGLREFSWGNTVKGGAIVQPNRNPILGKIAGADGIKTGHTDEAGYGFTGSAQQGPRRLVMVVAGLNSFDARIAESVRFMDWGFKSWAVKPLFPAGKLIGEAEVQMGSRSQVNLIAPRALFATYAAGTTPKFSLSIAYDGPIKAPIRKGQVIARLIVRGAGLPPQSMPLIAADDVAKAGFFRRAWLGLLSLFGF
jgi:serine-type D-Ala-D-Ala carboxypeptidase (penicillin-binding protein 5/6)